MASLLALTDQDNYNHSAHCSCIHLNRIKHHLIRTLSSKPILKRLSLHIGGVPVTEYRRGGPAWWNWMFPLILVCPMNPEIYKGYRTMFLQNFILKSKENKVEYRSSHAQLSTQITIYILCCYPFACLFVLFWDRTTSTEIGLKLTL